MTTPSIALIGVPSSAGAHNSGQETTPDLLRERGLLDRLRSSGIHVEDRGNTTERPFQVDTANPTARNADNVCATLLEVQDAVTGALADGAIPVLIGGDCTITLGAVTAARRRFGDIGVLYFDGDADLVTPDTTRSGILDAMVVAHLLGEANSPLTRTWDGGPLLDATRLAILGYDPDDPDSFDQKVIARHPQLSHFSYRQLREDPGSYARRGIDHVTGTGRRLVVHFDVDSIDSSELPLADFPHYATGLSVAAAQTVLTTLLQAPGLCAVVLTEVNPTHDTSGTSLDRYLQLISTALTDGLARPQG